MMVLTMLGKLNRTAGGVMVAWAMLGGVALGGEHDHHAHHHAAPAKVLNKSEVNYVMPSQSVMRMDGGQVDFAKALDAGGPVILNFIFTSCTTICPMTTQVFSRLQQRLNKESLPASLVSVSIDPEYDTPARLAAYAKKFNAEANWQFYTGSAKASVVIQKAFDAYRGDKMNHIPVTFFRMAPGQAWVRVEGLASADELFEIYRSLKKGGS